MRYKIYTEHILEKNGTAAICRSIEGLKLRSMLCLFIGVVCVCVHVDRHVALFGIERVVWFFADLCVT